jgi:hypothetical protein
MDIQCNNCKAYLNIREVVTRCTECKELLKPKTNNIMKTNYQVTIGYKAVVCIEVKASTEEEAKKKALEHFKNKERKKWYLSKGTFLQDDTFGAHGVCDMDKTWNEL